MGVGGCARTEARKPPPRAGQPLAVRLDPVDGLALVERRVRETALVDDDDLVARLATEAEDVLERLEGAEVGELGRQLFADLADHRILAALAELDSAAWRPIARHAFHLIDDLKDEDRIAAPDDGERERPRPAPQSRGRFRWWPVSPWYAATIATSSASLNGGPTSCSPTGRPSVPKPHGKKIAGTPARLPAAMRPIFPVRLFGGGVALAVVGGLSSGCVMSVAVIARPTERITSTSRNSDSSASCRRVRIRIACR